MWRFIDVRTNFSFSLWTWISSKLIWLERAGIIAVKGNALCRRWRLSFCCSCCFFNSHFSVDVQISLNRNSLPPPAHSTPITKLNLQRTRGSRPFFLVFLPLALFRLQNCVISLYCHYFPTFWKLPTSFPLPPLILAVPTLMFSPLHCKLRLCRCDHLFFVLS